MRVQAEAKAMRLEARRQAREDTGFMDMKFVAMFLRNALAEADQHALSWMDKFHARDARGNHIWQPTRRGPVRKRRPKPKPAEPESTLPAPGAKRPRKPLTPEYREKLLANLRRARAARERKRLVALDEAAEREREHAEKVAEWRNVGRKVP